MQSAIKVATGKLGLQPGAAFQARVAQLAELVKAHKLVSVSGLDQERFLQREVRIGELFVAFFFFVDLCAARSINW